MLRNGMRAGLALMMAAWASAGVIENVLAALSQGSESRAITELRTYSASHGATPELLAAIADAFPGTTTGYGAKNQWYLANVYHTNVYGEKGEIITAALASGNSPTLRQNLK